MFSMEALVPYRIAPVDLQADVLWVRDGRRGRKDCSPPRSARESLTVGSERLLRRDPAYRRYVRKVLERQRELRQSVEPAAWEVYLALEEAEVARWAYAFDVVMAWAFKRGRRS